MSALSKIRDAGFAVALVGDNLEVAPASSLTLPQREFLKQHKSEIIVALRSEVPTLSTTDQCKVLAWLDFIDDPDCPIDQELRDETLDRCQIDPETLAYFLHRAEEIPEPKQAALSKCRSCKDFKSYNSHGGGAGYCSAGVLKAGICLWADTEHQCEKYHLN